MEDYIKKYMDAINGTIFKAKINRFEVETLYKKEYISIKITKDQEEHWISVAHTSRGMQRLTAEKLREQVWKKIDKYISKHDKDKPKPPKEDKDKKPKKRPAKRARKKQNGTKKSND